MINRPYTRRWYQSLHIQVLFLLLFLGSVLALMTKIVVTIHGERQFARNEQDRLLLNGDDLVKDLGQSLRTVEATARAIALLGAQSQGKSDELFSLIPALLNANGGTIITGGGLWPEPYSRDPKREKDSIFWGRDNNGTLAFYDDYNRPEVAPYFREEWYVPATYLSAGQVYWSRSYVDPYSHESMATCTVPYYRDGRVEGVATIDITLAGLRKFLTAHCDRRNMYMFALDHSNHFLDFPRRDLIQPDAADSSAVRQFITTDDLAANQPTFQAMADTLGGLLATTVRQEQAAPAKVLTRLTWELNQRIPGLAPNEAEIIAAKLLAADQTATPEPTLLKFEDDLMFGEPSTAVVVPVPSTGWKIVAVTPSSFINARVTGLVAGINRPLLVALIVIVLVAAFGVRRFFLAPMSRLVTVMQDDPEDLVDTLDQVSSHNINEIGELAFLLASNTRDLRTAQLTAERSAQTKGALLANLSQEIQTPINRIMGAVNLLAEPDDALECEKVMIIRRSAESLQKVLNATPDSRPPEAQQPVSPDAAIATAPAAAQREVGDQHPLSIDVLLVEDNPTNRLVARKFLSRMGCTVTVACDGEEAVTAAANHEFDAILMDLQMPKMDGLTAARHIRALPGAIGQVPIVPLTANTSPQDRQNCLTAGMNDFLAKPVNSQELRQTLLRWVPAAEATG